MSDQGPVHTSPLPLLSSEQKIPQDSTPGAKVKTSPWPWASHLGSRAGWRGHVGLSSGYWNPIRSCDAVLTRHLLTPEHTHLSQN